MADETPEEIYDREIAPALLALAKKCEGHGFSIVAMVEFALGETGSTLSLRAGSGIEIRMALMAAQSLGNADALIGALLQHGKEHGHNSAFLHQLGARWP